MKDMMNEELRKACADELKRMAEYETRMNRGEELKDYEICAYKNLQIYVHQIEQVLEKGEIKMEVKPVKHEQITINWIPVEEDLPSEEDFVDDCDSVPCLLSIHVPDIETIYIGFFKKDGHFYGIENLNVPIEEYDKHAKVTAWALLPFPYDKKGEVK